MGEPNSESILKDFDLRQDLCNDQALFSIDSEGAGFTSIHLYRPNLLVIFFNTSFQKWRAFFNNTR